MFCRLYNLSKCNYHMKTELISENYNLVQGNLHIVALHGTVTFSNATWIFQFILQ